MQEAPCKALWSGRELSTFETLPRVGPWFGRGVGLRKPSARPTLWRHSLSRPPGRRLQLSLGGGQRGAGGGRGREPEGGGPRRARLREAPARVPTPGRLGERAEAAAAQPSRWVRVLGRSGSGLSSAAEVPSPDPGLAAASGGSGAGLGPQGAPQLFPDWATVGAAGEPRPRGGGFPETELCPVTVGWAGASGVFVRTRASRSWGFVGSGSGTCFCGCLCARGFSWLLYTRVRSTRVAGGCGSGHRRVSAYVDGAVDVSGWVTEERCALAAGRRPRSALLHRPPRGFKLFS